MIKLNETVNNYTRKSKAYIIYEMQNASLQKPFTFYIAPCNVMPDDEGLWVRPFDITVDKIYMDFDDAIQTINEFIYYNCQDELGDTVNFYIKQEGDKSLKDYTIIIQENCVIKVKNDILKTNTTELYDKNPTNNKEFQMLGYEDREDLLQILEEDMIK